MSTPSKPVAVPETATEVESERTTYSRVRVSNEASDTLRKFVEKHDTTNDDAIVCLIQAYELQTQ